MFLIAYVYLILCFIRIMYLLYYMRFLINCMVLIHRYIVEDMFAHACQQILKYSHRSKICSSMDKIDATLIIEVLLWEATFIIFTHRSTLSIYAKFRFVSSFFLYFSRFHKCSLNSCRKIEVFFFKRIRYIIIN